MSEWNDLTMLWQGTTDRVDASPLRRIAAAHRRRLLIMTAGEIALVVAFAGLSIVVASDGLVPWELVWLITLWSFMLVASAFVWWNRRGTWQALGESVEEYVRLTRLRAERQRHLVYFVCGLFVAETIVCVGQLVWFGRFTLFASILFVVSGAAIGLWCWSTKRKVASDLALLEEYTREA